MTRPLVSLVLILKDEEKVIEKTLDSCTGVVDSLVVVYDTESTDATHDVVLAWTQRHKISYAFENDKFEGYAAQRNKALDLVAASWGGDDSQRPVFTLTMSADETLHGGAELRAFLETHRDDTDGAYLVQMKTDVREWPYSRVLRTDAKWRYVGEYHEQPQAPDGRTKPTAAIPGAFIQHTESDPARKLRRIREKDLPYLTRFVDDESRPLLDRARNIWFLAESHLFLAHNWERDENGEHVPPGGAWFSHYMQAMALYWRHGQISEHAALEMPEGQDKNIALDSAFRAYHMHYYIADKIGLLGPGELEPRLETLAYSAPHMPEIWLQWANCAARIDPRRGQKLALDAFKIAEDADKRTDEVRFLAKETHIKWAALALAAKCAHALKDDKRAMVLAKKAIEYGCPKEMFKFEEKNA